MILITGLARSRSSLLAAMFEACGANFGSHDDFRSPDESNPLGYYENINLIKLEATYLDNLETRLNCDANYLEKDHIYIDENWREKVLGCLGQKVNAVKNPNISSY